MDENVGMIRAMILQSVEVLEKDVIVAGMAASRQAHAERNALIVTLRSSDRAELGDVLAMLGAAYEEIEAATNRVRFVAQTLRRYAARF